MKVHVGWLSTQIPMALPVMALPLASPAIEQAFQMGCVRETWLPWTSTLVCGTVRMMPL